MIYHDQGSCVPGMQRWLHHTKINQCYTTMKEENDYVSGCTKSIWHKYPYMILKMFNKLEKIPATQ